MPVVFVFAPVRRIIKKNVVARYIVFFVLCLSLISYWINSGHGCVIVENRDMPQPPVTPGVYASRWYCNGFRADSAITMPCYWKIDSPSLQKNVLTDGQVDAWTTD
jgi:hypothetical protein